MGINAKGEETCLRVPVAITHDNVVRFREINAKPTGLCPYQEDFISYI